MLQSGYIYWVYTNEDNRKVGEFPVGRTVGQGDEDFEAWVQKCYRLFYQENYLDPDKHSLVLGSIQDM